MKRALSPRLKMVLELVVRDYIKTAEPVASESLVKRHALNLSSATVRKVLSQLEEMGLLVQTHASSGRIPTEEGLRTYVRELLAVGRLSEANRALIDRELAGGRPEAVCALCSKVLSSITRHMGVVAGPSLDLEPLKNLYFVRLGPGEILAVMAGAGGLMRNRILTGQEDLSQDDLDQVNRYLAEETPGLTLDEIRLKIVQAMGDEKRAFDRLYERAFRLALASAENEDGRADRDLFMEGRRNLLEYPEFSETAAMRALFTAFEDKRRLMSLLNEVAKTGQVRIVLGP